MFRANIKLNSEKSGILEIVPKGLNQSFVVGSKFEGVPVVSEYKYLGLVLDNMGPSILISFFVSEMKWQEAKK